MFISLSLEAVVILLSFVADSSQKMSSCMSPETKTTLIMEMIPI